MSFSLALLLACRGDSAKPENVAPEAEIVSPVEDAAVVIGATAVAKGAASDADHDTSALTAVWTLDGDPLCAPATPSEGETLCAFEMPDHDATLVLEVTDPAGATGRAERFLRAQVDSAPTVQWVSPTAGATFDDSTAVLFEAVVADAESPATELSVTWTSSLDGLLATPATPDADGTVRGEFLLSAGAQTLTATVSDPAGHRGTASLEVTIEATPSAPLCTIDFPDDDAVVIEGDDFELRATLMDPDGDARDLQVELLSDLDGVLDTTPPSRAGDYLLESDSLSNGVHTLTLTAVDPTGLSCADVVHVRVDALPTAPTIVITPELAGTDDELGVTVLSEATDPDGDPVTYGYTWYRNGVAVATTPTVDPSLTTRGEVWSVLVTPNDGWFDGAHGTGSVTLGNTPPTFSTIEITPAAPVPGVDDLDCVAAASDPDGDPVLVNYAWTVDGVAAGTGDHMPREAVAEGATWTCTATADDSSNSSSASVSVTIGACPEGLYSACPGTSCAQLLADGWSVGDGVYWLQPASSAPYEVHCDMTTDGGGWTLVATISDDGVDTWTWTGRERFGASPAALGSASTPTVDHQSAAYGELPFTDLLFVHSSTTWAAYGAVGDGVDGLDEFVGALGEPTCQDDTAGWPMTAGTLAASGDLCSTDLYFNAQDRDGAVTCDGGSPSDAYGPSWSGAGNDGCPLDDAGSYGLGPASDAPTSESDGLGFGHALGLNTGAAGTGANWMQVYVR